VCDFQFRRDCSLRASPPDRQRGAKEAAGPTVGLSGADAGFIIATSSFAVGSVRVAELFRPSPQRPPLGNRHPHPPHAVRTESVTRLHLVGLTRKSVSHPFRDAHRRTQVTKGAQLFEAGQESCYSRAGKGMGSDVVPLLSRSTLRTLE